MLQVGYVGNHVTHLLTDGVISPRNINRRDPVTVYRPLDLPQFRRHFPRRIVSVVEVQCDAGDLQAKSYQGIAVQFQLHVVAHDRRRCRIFQGLSGRVQHSRRACKQRPGRSSQFRFRCELRCSVPHAGLFGDGVRAGSADGWQIATITQFRTGLPVNVTRQGGVFGGFTLRPDLVPGVDPYSPNNASVTDSAFRIASSTRMHLSILQGPLARQRPTKLPPWTRVSHRWIFR